MGSVATESSKPALASSDAPPVAAHAVEFRYGARVTLRDVHAQVQHGEVFGVIGPNGAGKSTLLRLLAGLAAPAAGQLAWFGAPAMTSAVRRRIGYLPDDAALFDELTGLENLRLFARIRRLALASDAAPAEARAVGLTDSQLQAVTSSYSFGMRRKLALAQTLVGSPELLLLDEPTIGLDPNARDRLVALIAERKKHGATVIASNDLRVVEDACDRVAFLDAGQVVLQGQPHELLAPLRRAVTFVVTTREPCRPFALGDAEVSTIDERSVHIRSSRGASLLPHLIETMLRAGNTIETVAVRPPDLSDVFRQVTGTDWLASEAGT
ncbi:MAG: ABC transporter ATP-binding protein [Longimicrobiales bacterium]